MAKHWGKFQAYRSDEEKLAEQSLVIIVIIKQSYIHVYDFQTLIIVRVHKAVSEHAN